MYDSEDLVEKGRYRGGLRDGKDGKEIREI